MNSINMDTFSEACVEGNVKAVLEILDTCEHQQDKDKVMQGQDSKGDTPLYLTIQNECSNVTEILLDNMTPETREESILLRNDSGLTCFHHACRNKDITVAKLLFSGFT